MTEYSRVFRNGHIYTPQGILRDGYLIVRSDGTIAALSDRMPEEHVWDTVIELNGRSVIPGLIDVHVHGGNGFDVMDGSAAHLEQISRFHARHGTTALLATTNGADEERLVRALRNAAESIRQGTGGAEIAGIHLEGPFLNEKRKGAFRSDDLRLPSRRELERYLDAAEGHIRIVTLAPELPGGYEAVRLLKKHGVTVSIGHSDATYAEMAEAVKLGADHTTHHFNGMRPLHHREPGVAGAGLAMPSLTVELIPDGIHLHPAIVKLLYDVKSEWNVCVVTDAVSAAGMPDGEYGDRQVIGGQVRLNGMADTLAGSTLTAIQALRNVIRFTGYALDKVLPSFTAVPARQSGLAHRKGSLEPGKDADFLIVDDQLTIHATYVRGREVYRA